MKTKLFTLLTLLLCLGSSGVWADANTTLIENITLPSTPTTSYDLNTGNVVWGGTGNSTKYLIKLDANGNAIMVGAAGGYGTTSAVRTFANAYNSSDGSWSTTGDTWEAPESSIFRGSSAYGSGSDYDTQINAARKGNLRKARTFAFRFTGAGGFSALVKSSGSTDARAAVLAVYQLNTSTGALTPFDSKSTKTNAVDILTVEGLSSTDTYVAFIYGMDDNNGCLYEIAFLAPTKSVISKVLTGININGSAWEISGLSDNAATITTSYNDVPEVEFVYTINYDDDSSDTGQIEEVTATKDGDIFVAASTVLTNNVTLTFTNVTAKALPELAYAATAVAKLTTDANFTNPLTNPHDLDVTYSVVAGATATGVEVNESTGEVSIGSVAGTATIKASFAGNETYQAGEATYVLTVNLPTCAVPTYTLGSYNYEQEGYEIVASCDTDGATLQYKIGNGEWTACTADVAFYAKSGKLYIKASKVGYNDATIASGIQWTLNGAPSSTSPETLIPFQTSGDDGEKNKAHVYKSVTFGENNNASSVGGVSGSNGLKLRTNQTHGDFANSIKFYVHDGYKVTNIQMTGNSNNSGTGATIDVNGMYIDDGDNTISSVEGNKTFPISSASAATFDTGTIEATDNIVLTFDNTYVSSGNKQLKVSIVVTYEVTAVTVSTKSGRNYGTYVTNYKLDFSSAEGITAYIAKGFNGAKDAIVLKEVDVVPASTPIIVMTDSKGASVSVPVTTSDPSDVSLNALVAGDGTTAWNGTDGYTYYYIASDEFHKATSGTLQSGKAYLKISSSLVPVEEEARSFGFVVDDEETTGVVEVRGKKEEFRGDFFDLQGRKVAQPTKGLYIVNGRKVVIK